jgi:hypothetical protein
MVRSNWVNRKDENHIVVFDDDILLEVARTVKAMQNERLQKENREGKKRKT